MRDIVVIKISHPNCLFYFWKLIHYYPTHTTHTHTHTHTPIHARTITVIYSHRVPFHIQLNYTYRIKTLKYAFSMRVHSFESVKLCDL